MNEFESFAEEVRHVHVTWTLWRRLFHKRDDDYASPAEFIDAGNEAYRVTGKTSELVFVYARWHMLRGVVLDLCRLTDPKQTGRHDNLTVERILESTSVSPPGAAKHLAHNRASHLHEVVRQDMTPIRDKIIAHFDVNVALGRAPLPDADIERIDLAVRLLIGFTHAARCAREGRVIDAASPESRADRSIEHEWNKEADRLIEVLARGLDASQSASAR